MTRGAIVDLRHCLHHTDHEMLHEEVSQRFSNTLRSIPLRIVDNQAGTEETLNSDSGSSISFAAFGLQEHSVPTGLKGNAWLPSFWLPAFSYCQKSNGCS